MLRCIEFVMFKSVVLTFEAGFSHHSSLHAQCRIQIRVVAFAHDAQLREYRLHAAAHLEHGPVRSFDHGIGCGVWTIKHTYLIPGFGFNHVPTLPAPK